MKKLLSVLLVFALYFSSVPIEAFARDNIPKRDIVPSEDIRSVGAVDSTATERTGWGVRLGIGRCYNETYNGKDDFTSWVNDYSSRYYIRAEGECVYYYTDGTGLYSDNSIGSYTQQAFDSILNGGDFLSHVSSPTEWVKSDSLGLMNELASLGSVNQALVTEWKQQQELSEPYHPLVLCFEAFCAYSGMGKMVYTCADLADTMNFTDLCVTPFPSERTTAELTSDYTVKHASNTATSEVSAVGLDTMANNGIVFNQNSMPGFAFQGMYGFYPVGNIKTIEFGDVANGASNISFLVMQPNNNITGCYTLPIIAPEDPQLKGSYTWHINAEGAPPKTFKGITYTEDGTVDIPVTQSGVDKTCQIVDFDIYQRNYAKWIRYIKLNKIDSVDVTIQLFSKGTAGNTANFTTQHDAITLDSDPIPIGIKDPDTREKVEHLMAKDFIAKISDPNDSKLATHFDENIFGDLYDGILAVSYATKVSVTLNGATGSTTVPLENSQSHFAIYGHDDGSTYKFLQVLQPAYTQIKEGELDHETYEAMAGVPTTEDLFISQGGEQWVVNMQYRYVDTDYTRAYRFKTKEPYPNYLYYKTGEGDSQYEFREKTGWYDCQNSEDPLNITEGNYGYTVEKATWNQWQTTTRDKMHRALRDSINNILGNIDDNYMSREDYDYGVIVRKSTLESPVILGDDKDKIKYTQNLFKNLLKDIEFNESRNVAHLNGMRDLRKGHYVIPLFHTPKGNDLDSTTIGSVNLVVDFGRNYADEYWDYPTTFWHTYSTETATSVSCACGGAGCGCPGARATSQSWFYSWTGAGEGSRPWGGNCGCPTYYIYVGNPPSPYLVCGGGGAGAAGAAGAGSGSTTDSMSRETPITNLETSSLALTENIIGQAGNPETIDDEPFTDSKEQRALYVEHMHEIADALRDLKDYYDSKGTDNLTKDEKSVYKDIKDISQFLATLTQKKPRLWNFWDELVSIWERYKSGNMEADVSIPKEIIKEAKLLKAYLIVQNDTDANVVTGAEHIHETNTPTIPGSGWSWPFGDEGQITYGGQHVPPVNYDTVIHDYEYYKQGFWWQTSIVYDNVTPNIKTLSYDKTLYQTFQDVKYMDIVDCHVWRLIGGVEKGLSSLLCTTQQSIYDPFVQLAAKKHGYVLYDIGDNSGATKWETPSQSNDSESAWTYRSSRSTNGYSSKVNALQKDGRVANSMNPSSTVRPASMQVAYIPEYFVKGDFVNAQNSSDPHSFRVVSGPGDTLVFEYDIGMQGGRSHRCYKGFLLQALALTLYGGNNPSTAYKNYIACQSDYLSLDTGSVSDQWITLVGFFFNSKDYIENSNNMSHGLAQSILSNFRNDVSKYWRVQNECWKKGTYTAPFDNAPMGDRTDVTATENNQVLFTLENYQDCSGQVILNRNNTYKSYTKTSLNGLQDTTKGSVVKGLNNEFVTSFLSAGLTEYDKMNYVGYKGKYETSSVSHNTQGNRVSQTFDPHATLVTDGCATVGGGDTFAKYLVGLNGNWRVNNSATIPSVTGQGFKEVYTDAGAGNDFPYGIGYNTQRCLPNSTYETGQGAVVYEKCISAAYTNSNLGHITSLSLYDGYTDAHQTINDSIGDLDTPLKEAYPVINPKGILHRADYSDGYGSVNEIVIYNPVSADGVMLSNLDNTDTLPDALNIYDEDHHGYSVRSQVVDSYVTTYDDLEETYLSGIPVDTSPSETVRYNYTLKAANNTPSEMETTYYTMEDYQQVSSVNTNSYSVSNGNSVNIAASGNYNITVIGESGHKINLFMPLNSGDVLTLRNNNLYLNYKQTAYNVNFDSLQKSLDDYYELNVNQMPDDYDPSSSFINVTEGLTLTVSVGTTLQQGEVIKFTLPFEYGFDNTADVEFMTSVADDCFIYRDNSDSKIVCYYLEAKAATKLTAVKVKFNYNNTINTFTGSLIESVPTFLCEVTESSNVHVISTLDHDYNGAGTGGTSSRNALFTQSEFEASNAGSTPGTAYISAPAGVPSFALKSEALANKHKVYNSNWRYYVLGWSTTGGKVITDANDPVLYDDTTVLVYPYTDGTISVEDIKATCCLVKYNDTLYLTTKDDARQHKITSRNLQGITSFDNWSLGVNDGSGTISLTPLNFGSLGYNQYPLKTAAELGSIESWTYKSIYEFCFNISNDDGPLFDVRYSTNPNYYFARNTTTKIYYDAAIADTTGSVFDRDADWEKTPMDEAVLDVVESTGHNQANVLALDDEFLVIWPNIAKLGSSQSGSRNIATVSDVIGAGWDHTPVDNNVPNHSELQSYVSSAFAESYTETTKWLYIKYITFNFPVYGFYNDSDLGTISYTLNNFNPTRGMTETDGTQNRMVQIPANTRIYLGYYQTDSEDDDNSGQFIDFGAPGQTKDPSSNYTYHFWCALGSGERAGAEMHAEAIAINSTGKDVQYSGDEYSTYIWLTQNTKSLNHISPVESTIRYSDAESNKTVDIVGRIGALTIVESEDPRWSDTFKNGSLSSDYLIYPLVKKISSYSNTPGNIGSQNKIIIDPFDVRGRIASEDILNTYIDTLPPEERELYSNYNVYESNMDYNTYGTQWYKGESGAKRSILPLIGDDNVHPELQLTEQKIGYNLYCTLETIGNYYGTSNWNEDRVNENYINDSADYNNYKVQIRPIYSVALGKTKGGILYNGYVDAYMRLGNDYVMINSGSTKARDYLKCMADSYYIYDIETNTGKDYELDQNMIRHSVTEQEAATTKTVLNWMNAYEHNAETLGTTGSGYDNPIDSEDRSATSLLTQGNYHKSILGGEGSDTKYTYGNSQLLFLRERNRTFIGGNTIALNGADIADEDNNAMCNKLAHAQKWYFEIGVASSTIFVPTGMQLTTDNILDSGYCVCGLDIYANGNPFLLHYISDISNAVLTIQPNSGEPPVKLGPSTADCVCDWNYHRETYPHLIPFAYYDLSESNSSIDIDSQGSH